MNKKYFSSLFLLMTIISLGIATSVFAQTDQPPGGQPPSGMMQRKPGVMGKVTAINGNTITITGKQRPEATEDVTYTVDASSAKIEKNMVTISVSDITVGDTLMVEGTISGTSVAATSIIDGIGRAPSGNKTGDKKETSKKEPGVMGKVTAISGTTITITSKNSIKKTSTTTTTSVTYVVDASNATVEKNNVSGSISDIVVGDTISVEGTISGTSVTATKIRDGMAPQKKDNSSTDSKVVANSGNGQPVIAGTVTVINGSVLTITNKSNVTYTVDTTNAKITKDQGAVITISDIAVGDTVIAQGTINGTAVVASSVIDQTKVTIINNSTTNTERKGFFGSIGSFFANLFGF